jgi:hypothetical protein
LEQLSDGIQELKEAGLSSALLQSRYLEANNKVLKVRSKTLPGSGKSYEDSGSNYPIFLSLKHVLSVTACNDVRQQQRSNPKKRDHQKGSGTVEAMHRMVSKTRRIE